MTAKRGSKYLFFHKVVKTRQSRNKIMSLTATSGDLLTDSQAITNEILKNFEGFLGSSGVSNPNISQILQNLIVTRLFDVDHPRLTVAVTTDEIYSVVKCIPNNKALGQMVSLLNSSSPHGDHRGVDYLCCAGIFPFRPVS